jgi:hypothetical protein
MTTSAQFVSVPRVGAAIVTNPDTSRTAPTVASTVMTATATASSGTRIDNIDINAIATVTSTMLRLFEYDGATYHLFMEIPLSNTTAPSSSTPVLMQALSSATNPDKFPLILPTGHSLRATVNDAQVVTPANAQAISLSQSIASGALASLNGGLGTLTNASTAAVSALQTTGAAAIFTQTAYPYSLTVPSVLSLTSTGNISGVNFTISGLDSSGAAVTETLAGPNNNTVYTNTVFASVEKVYANGAVGTNTSVGYGAVKALDFASKITITSSTNLAAVNFTIIGTNTAGVTTTEVLAGPAAGLTVTSANTYKSISVIKPNGLANPTLIGTPAVMGGIKVIARGGDFA